MRINYRLICRPIRYNSNSVQIQFGTTLVRHNSGFEQLFSTTLIRHNSGSVCQWTGLMSSTSGHHAIVVNIKMLLLSKPSRGGCDFQITQAPRYPLDALNSWACSQLLPTRCGYASYRAAPSCRVAQTNSCRWRWRGYIGVSFVSRSCTAESRKYFPRRILVGKFWLVDAFSLQGGTFR
jgi:hypothetical protein